MLIYILRFVEKYIQNLDICLHTCWFIYSQMSTYMFMYTYSHMLLYTFVYIDVTYVALQCVAVCCSVLQCVRVCSCEFIDSLTGDICRTLLLLDCKDPSALDTFFARANAINYNSQQHNATQCNTLQFIGAHCNSLQLTAALSNPLLLTAGLCGTRLQGNLRSRRLSVQATITLQLTLYNTCANSSACRTTRYYDDDCFYCHSWRNNVVIAFGTLQSFLT